MKRMPTLLSFLFLVASFLFASSSQSASKEAVQSVAMKLDRWDVEEAWGEVIRNVGSVGSYGSPSWSSEALRKAVDALGWKTICLTPDKDVGTLRAHFFRIYNSQMQRECVDKVSEFRVSPEVMSLLSGIGKPPTSDPKKLMNS